MITYVGDDTPMSLLGLPKGVLTSLASENYSFIEDLDEADDNELLAVKGIGKSAVSKIRKAIVKYLE